MTVSIACVSGKGGVGKTTTCASLAAVFAERGRRVLAVTDFIVIPVQMSGYAIKGLKETLRTVHEARDRLNPRLRVLGLLPTFVVPRTRFSRDMLEGLRAIPNVRMFDTVVKTTVRLQESGLAGEPIT